MTDLEFIQSLTEEEFCEWVLIPLLDAMGYSNIRYTHGYLERGKDIVFCSEDKLEGKLYCCATVKRYSLTGSVTGSRSIREVVFQISQALSSPFVDPSDGTHVQIKKVFVVTPYQIGQPAIQSISDELQRFEHRLTFIDGPLLVSLIKKYLPGLMRSLPTPEARYIYLLCQKFLDNPTLSRLGSSTRPLTLLDVYTGGQLSPITKDDAKYISFALPSHKDHVGSLEHLTTIIQKNAQCVVLADVGSGKTTLLQKLALDIGGFGSDTVPSIQKTIPIFVPLSQIPEDSLKTFRAFKSSITKHVTASDKFEGFDLDCTHNCVLLLDGFDELQGHHDKVQKYLIELAPQVTRLVITSRPSRTPDLPSSFAYYRLMPFGDSDIKLFLSKWFADKPQLQADVLARLIENTQLLQFCRTPLILTLYSLLACNTDTVSRLPIRRTAIYEELIEMLLGRWDQLRSVRNLFAPDVKQHVLELIAYDTHVQRRRSFLPKALDTIVADVLGVSASESDRNNLINELIFRSSLIRKCPTGELEFVHLSFQEFLTSRRLCRHLGGRQLSAYIPDDWWKGCLVFYFGICRTLDGITLSRRRKRASGLGLVFMEFLAEADFTGSKKRTEVIGLLVEDLLGSANVTRSDLQIFQQLGNVLVRILEEAVGKPDFTGNCSNYFAILRAIGSQQAIETLWKGVTYLKRLSMIAMLEEVNGAIVFVSDEGGTHFITTGMTLLIRRLQKDTWSDPRTVTHCCRLLKETDVTIGAFSKQKLIDPVQMNRLLESWRGLQEVFVDSLSRDGMWRRFELADIRAIFDVVAEFVPIYHGIEVLSLCLRHIGENGHVKGRHNQEVLTRRIEKYQRTLHSVRGSSVELVRPVLREIQNDDSIWSSGLSGL